MADPTNRVFCCPVELVIELIESKWKPALLLQLGVGIQCFGELSRRMPLVSERVLGQLLRELENDGLVERILHNRIPVRVEYVLTRTGRRLGPILSRMAAFGSDYAVEHKIEILGDSSAEDSGPVALPAVAVG